MSVFIEGESARVYEWQNNEGVRFRVITDNIRKKTCIKSQHNIKGEGHNFHSPPLITKLYPFILIEILNQWNLKILK